MIAEFHALGSLLQMLQLVLLARHDIVSLVYLPWSTLELPDVYVERGARVRGAHCLNIVYFHRLSEEFERE